MWRRRGKLLLHANSQTLSNIGNFLNEHGGVRGERQFPPHGGVRGERQFPPPLKAFVPKWI